MQPIAELIFSLSTLLLIYTYLLYPILLFSVTSLIQIYRDLRYLFDKEGRRVPTAILNPPPISIVVAAFNEEQVIEEKINNILSLNYPKDRMEVVIASDGSDDRTNKIVSSYADRGVMLVPYTERAGKVAVLNRTIPKAQAEIIVLTDANTIYEREALLKLTRHFHDMRIGFVVGDLRLHSASESVRSEGIYWRYEMILKFLENKLNIVLVANGAIYAIRKKAFRPMPPDTISDDLIIPMTITEQGYLARFEPEAVAHEETGKDVHAEFVRHTRIGAGEFQSIWRTRRLLNPFLTRVAFCYVSHKLLRWLGPFFMIGAFSSNLLLLDSPFYQFTALLQIVFYTLAIVGYFQPPGPPWLRHAFLTPYYFVSINVALLVGFVRFLSRSQRPTWERTER